MDWKIVDTLASPDTGSFFSIAQTAKSLKLILWCKGDYFLQQGNTLTTAAQGLVVNGKTRNITVIHASPYNPQIWRNLLQKTGCPGNSKDATGPCSADKKCLFSLCPYGLREYKPQQEQPEQLHSG